MEDIINDGKPEYPRYTDQRHTFSFVLDTKPGRGWDANIRVFFGSGSAFTPSESKYNSTTKRWQWIEGKRNSATLPVYSRIDFKIGKKFLLFGLNAEAFLDIINLFNQTNLMAYRYTFNSNGTPKREDIKLFPIIPSLGLKLSF